MRNRFRQWVRHLALLSLTSVGILTSSNSHAHDLPIFDSRGLYNCFGLNAPVWQSELISAKQPGQQSQHDKSTIQKHAASSNWCFADSQLDTSADEADTFDPFALNCFNNQSNARSSIGNSTFPTTQNFGLLDAPELSDEPCLDQEAMGEFESETGGSSIISTTLVGCRALIQAAKTTIDELDLADFISQFRDTLASSAYVQSNSAVVTSARPLDLSAQIATFEQDAFRNQNPFRTRPLVDDYMSGESFVRDWRSLQSLNLFGRNDKAIDYSFNPTNDVLPHAISSHRINNVNLLDGFSFVVSQIENAQCWFSQEAYQPELSKQLGAYVAKVDIGAVQASCSTFDQVVTSIKSLPERQSTLIASSSKSNLDVLGQPLFVIQRLDGKEFLLPAKQALHWNSVPTFAFKSARTSFPWPQNFVLKSGIDQRTDVTTQSSGPGIYNLENAARGLIETTSQGLDRIADSLRHFAIQLRSVINSDSQIANRENDGDVR